jgi:3-hydroxyisobutyrate dehydrogenase-like beta-hydroxyacid dehydrogenase
MVEGDFSKRAALAIQLKDMRNALHTSAGLGFDAPITTALTALYTEAVQAGLADQDQAALYQALKWRQGKPNAP